MVFKANEQFFGDDSLYGTEFYEQTFSQFKSWLLEAYEWPTTAEELTSACAFRVNLQRIAFASALPYVTDPAKKA